MRLFPSFVKEKVPGLRTGRNDTRNPSPETTDSNEKEKQETMQVQHLNAKALTKTAPLSWKIPTSLPQVPKTPSSTQNNTAVLIGLILRCGVIVSASITLLGLLLVLLVPGGLSTQRVLTFPDTIGQVYVGLLAFHPQAIIVLGLLLLIATPVLSVAASAVAFARERDHLYMTIALIVLGILITSFFLGKGMS